MKTPAPRSEISAPSAVPRPVAPDERHGQIGAVCWRAPAKFEYRAWVLEGKRIGLMCRGSPWWIGDWLLYGNARWGEMYAAAAKITGYDPKSLRNMRYVASRFHVSLRKDNLTWSHHAVLASLDVDQQRYWLERASHDRLSVEDLRAELRAERHGQRRSLDEPPRARERRSDTAMITCPNCGDRVPVPRTIRP